MIMAMQMLIPYALGGFALSFLSLTGCKPATDSPTTKTVTKNVSVGAIPFVQGATLSFAPSYTPDGGWGDNFQAADITYTLTDDMGHSDAHFPGGVVAADLYSHNTYPKITQTFYYQGDPVGSRDIVLEIIDPGGAPRIDGMYTNAADFIESSVISVTLNLSKQVPVTD